MKRGDGRGLKRSWRKLKGSYRKLGFAEVKRKLADISTVFSKFGIVR